MADTIKIPPAAALNAQLAALESMYATERRCDEARKLLDLIHAKRDEIAMHTLAADRADLDAMRTVVA